MVTRITASRPADAGARSGLPTLLLVLVTVGSWVGFLVVQLSLLPAAERAMVERGEAPGAVCRLVLDVGVWWAKYWWVYPPPLLFVLVALGLVHGLSPRTPFRRRLGWAWLLVGAAVPAVAALAALVACYCA
jgi:hypothetical protein